MGISTQVASSSATAASQGNLWYEATVVAGGVMTWLTVGTTIWVRKATPSEQSGWGATYMGTDNAGYETYMLKFTGRTSRYPLKVQPTPPPQQTAQPDILQEYVVPYIGEFLNKEKMQAALTSWVRSHPKAIAVGAIVAGGYVLVATGNAVGVFKFLAKGIWYVATINPYVTGAVLLIVGIVWVVYQIFNR
ncbi:hypothetical protein FJY90_05295 [Candidatus Gottesmanbacteria bacterium]|nr:hypothetical protein [Candidatus Gottesmanbacteria bacterium]